MLTYASETSHDIVKTRLELQTTEIQTISKIVGVHRRDGMRSQEIRRLIRVQPLVSINIVAIIVIFFNLKCFK